MMLCLILLIGYFCLISITTSASFSSGSAVPPGSTHLKYNSVEPRRAGAAGVTISRRTLTSRPFSLQKALASLYTAALLPKETPSPGEPSFYLYSRNPGPLE